MEENTPKTITVKNDPFKSGEGQFNYERSIKAINDDTRLSPYQKNRLRKRVRKIQEKLGSARIGIQKDSDGKVNWHWKDGTIDSERVGGVTEEDRSKVGFDGKGFMGLKGQIFDQALDYMVLNGGVDFDDYVAPEKLPEKDVKASDDEALNPDQNPDSDLDKDPASNLDPNSDKAEGSKKTKVSGITKEQQLRVQAQLDKDKVSRREELKTEGQNIDYDKYKNNLNSIFDDWVKDPNSKNKYKVEGDQILEKNWAFTNYYPLSEWEEKLKSKGLTLEDWTNSLSTTQTADKGYSVHPEVKNEQYKIDGENIIVKSPGSEYTYDKDTFKKILKQRGKTYEQWLAEIQGSPSEKSNSPVKDYPTEFNPITNTVTRKTLYKKGGLLIKPGRKFKSGGLIPKHSWGSILGAASGALGVASNIVNSSEKTKELNTGTTAETQNIVNSLSEEQLMTLAQVARSMDDGGRIPKGQEGIVSPRDPEYYYWNDYSSNVYTKPQYIQGAPKRLESIAPEINISKPDNKLKTNYVKTPIPEVNTSYLNTPIPDFNSKGKVTIPEFTFNENKFNTLQGNRVADNYINKYKQDNSLGKYIVDNQTGNNNKVKGSGTGSNNGATDIGDEEKSPSVLGTLANSINVNDIAQIFLDKPISKEPVKLPKMKAPIIAQPTVKGLSFDDEARMRKNVVETNYIDTNSVDPNVQAAIAMSKGKQSRNIADSFNTANAQVTQQSRNQAQKVASQNQLAQTEADNKNAMIDYKNKVIKTQHDLDKEKAKKDWIGESIQKIYDRGEMVSNFSDENKQILTDEISDLQDAKMTAMNNGNDAEAVRIQNDINAKYEELKQLEANKVTYGSLGNIFDIFKKDDDPENTEASK